MQSHNCILLVLTSQGRSCMLLINRTQDVKKCLLQIFCFHVFVAVYYVDGKLYIQQKRNIDQGEISGSMLERNYALSTFLLEREPSLTMP